MSPLIAGRVLHSGKNARRQRNRQLRRLGAVILTAATLSALACARDQHRGTSASRHDMIRLTAPAPGALVASPLRVAGEARGPWFFEASFPIRLLDPEGREIAVGHAQAQGEWMTEKFVPFGATLQFRAPVSGSAGTLVLEKDNPSGLPENADELRVPVRFFADRAAAFADRVWRVSRSSSGSTGDLYVFLSDSTLLVASSHGTPALGRWSYGRDTLTLVEEGIPYRAEVLGLSRDEFSIRIYSPGDPVELTFAPAR